MLDVKALDEASTLHPEIVAYRDKHGLPETSWHDAEAVKATVREVEMAVLRELGPPEADVNEWQLKVPTRDGAFVLANAHGPRDPPAVGSPLVILMHGGGWISGSRDQFVGIARQFVNLYGATVLCVGYRLAPEYPFPTAQLDCWDAVRWAAQNASVLGADPNQGFVVGGGSAGGNCAVATALLGLETPLRYPITGQWLLCPALLDAHVVPGRYKANFTSREQNVAGPLMPTAAMDYFKQFTKWDDTSPLRYPTLSAQGLERMPPTYFQACGADPLRDDALIFAQLLRDAGVETIVDFYPGCPHVHWGYLPNLEVSRQTMSDMCSGMAWLLGKGTSDTVTRGATRVLPTS